MQVARVMVVGGAFLLALIPATMLGSGLLAAASFMLALFVTAVTVGGALGMAMASDMQHSSRHHRSRRRSRHCSLCRDLMVRIGSVWACSRCDRVRTGSQLPQ